MGFGDPGERVNVFAVGFQLQGVLIDVMGDHFQARRKSLMTLFQFVG
jgi:hypothetical protein